MKKLLIITDTTDRQTNGVVRTLSKTCEILGQYFHVHKITPECFRTVALPFYKEIDITLNAYKIGKKIEDIDPDYIHIATEGPVGLAGKLYCDRKNYRYTTSYHSMFPEFISEMFHLPSRFTYWYFRWFHSNSCKVLVPTQRIKNLLSEKKFQNLVVWNRGVDGELFNPIYREKDKKLRYILCVSRVSKEKGLDDFCKIVTPEGYCKILVGDGPYLKELKEKYRTENVLFLGKKTGELLSALYASADVFVFPSKNDTFGLTQLEAIASGTPVLAYKNTASDDIIEDGVTGYLVNSFDHASITAALSLSRDNVIAASKKWSWHSCTDIFKNNLVEK